MIRLFAGFDPREAAGFHVFCQSVIEFSSVPVSIIPLSGRQRDGTNAFTYARFMVPQICAFSGWAIFADASDMLLRADLAELWALCEGKAAVKVVKHEYSTRHPRKYVGTPMECENADYPRKNWSSLILWNCAHIGHFHEREQLKHADGAYLHRFAWLADSEIGELPREWNWLADEYGENAQAKLLHWTAGIPGFAAYHTAPHAEEWLRAAERTMAGCQ